MGNYQSHADVLPKQNVTLQEDNIPYRIGETIGEGNFGVVLKATHRATKKVVVIKKLRKLNDNEVKILRKADHENIVRLLDAYSDSEKTWIVLEFCESGSLDTFLKEKRPTNNQRLSFIKDVSAGLAYLHGIAIIHRDLKPSNVLVDKNSVAKISDFGVSKLWKPEGTITCTGTVCGTFLYMAPEIISGQYNLQADIFSLGLVFCAILSDKLKRETESKPIGITMTYNPDYRYNAPDNLDDFMKNLLMRMLERDHHVRPKAHEVHQQLLQHVGAPPKPPTLMSKNLVAAGIAACIGVRVLLPKQVAKLPSNTKIKKFTIRDLFHFTNPALVSLNENSSRMDGAAGTDTIDVMFRSTGGSTGVFGISSDATVSDLRKLISLNAHLPEDYLELFHRSCRIEDENEIRLEGIGQGSVIQVHNVGENTREVVYEMDESLLDPRFNYDFTNLNDGGTQYFRGERVYQRPCGWYRHALKVKGQYDDDIWLGELRSRTHSSPNEWPVSYHGSKMRNSNIPLGNSSTASAAVNGLHGVVTTPSLDKVADQFAETFHFEGNTYQIALQNRVNPDHSEDHMVVIHGEGSDASVEYWFSPKEDSENGVCDVRPYGILIRLVDD